MAQNNNNIHRWDGWLNWFHCLDENDNDVTDIRNLAVKITLINNADSRRFVSSFTIEHWREMGAAISHCKNLRELSLDYIPGGLNAEIIMALFRAEGPYEFPLRTLNLEENGIGPRGLAALLPFLRSRGGVYDLSICHSNLGDEGAHLMAEALDSIRVSALNLASNNITVEGLSSIFASTNARHLERMGLEGNCLGRAEIDAISRFLRRDDTSLVCLGFGHTDMDVPCRFEADWVDMLVDSLRCNTSLEEFHLDADLYEQRADGNESKESVFDRVSSAISSLVCDVSSVDALCASNHVLRDMLWPPVFLTHHNSLPYVKHALDINAMENLSPNQKIRRKLASIYFQDEILVRSLVSMEPVYIPHVLELPSTIERCTFFVVNYAIGEEDNLNGMIQDEESDHINYAIGEEDNLNGMYQLVRLWVVPELFSAPFRPPSPIRQLEAEMDAMRNDFENRIERLERSVFGAEREIRQLEGTVRRLEAENSVLMRENKRLSSVIDGDRSEGGSPSNKRSHRDSTPDNVL